MRARGDGGSGRPAFGDAALGTNDARGGRFAGAEDERSPALAEGLFFSRLANLEKDAEGGSAHEAGHDEGQREFDGAFREFRPCAGEADQKRLPHDELGEVEGGRIGRVRHSGALSLERSARGRGTEWSVKISDGQDGLKWQDAYAQGASC